MIFILKRKQVQFPPSILLMIGANFDSNGFDQNFIIP